MSPSPPVALVRRGFDWLDPYRVDDGVAERFRARQLRAVLRVTPAAMVANVSNVALVLAACLGHGQDLFLWAWALVVFGLVLHGARGWHRARTRSRDVASRRAIRRATLQAALLGVVWGAMPVALFTPSQPEQQLIVATVTTGMICAGAFALSPVPQAGVAYVVTLAFGSLVALALSGLAVAPMLAGLLAVYASIVVASVITSSRLFGARLVAEADATRQNEVIGLLLRDFEEHASDLLVEIDGEGRLRHVSPRLVRLFGLPPHELVGVPLVDLLARFSPDDEDSRSCLPQLVRQLSARAPFQDFALPVRRKGRTFWWSIAAKPLQDERGRPAGWRGVARDVTAARRANQQLTWMAHNDELTGLANRHQLRTRLGEMLDDGGGVAVICLDLDHFKSVNDTLGHAAGDTLLRTVADRLRGATRRSDVIGRLGGDEFAVLLQTSQVDEARRLTQRIVDVLRQPCDVGGVRLSTFASVGLSMAPMDGTDVDTLLSHADLALYAAKAAGRNEWRSFEPQLALSTRRRIAIEHALRDAVARGDLRLAFQPQVAVDDWRVTGFEALVRWRDPELGDVSPAEFVPVAEQAGLMPALGAWVLGEACRAAAAWPGALLVSVNVSPLQVMDGAFGGLVQQAAAGAGLPMARLELEITESALVNQSSDTPLRTLSALRAAGARIAVDDFGTGYSALDYLRRFPFDTLKIDRGFVRDLVDDPHTQAIVQMILGLADTLGMQTVAEGVERPDQARILVGHRCRTLQGYLVSRPLEASQVVPFLDGWRGRPCELDSLDTPAPAAAPAPIEAEPGALSPPG